MSKGKSHGHLIPRIAARDGRLCHYCQVPIADVEDYVLEIVGEHRFWTLPDGFRSGTIDHKIPKSKGGTNKPENLVLACSSCNSKKGWRVSYEDFKARFTSVQS